MNCSIVVFHFDIYLVVRPVENTNQVILNLMAFDDKRIFQFENMRKSGIFQNFKSFSHISFEL